MLLFPSNTRTQACQICRKEKSLSDFPLVSPTKHSQICKDCQSKTVKTWQNKTSKKQPNTNNSTHKHFSIDYYFGKDQNTSEKHFHTKQPCYTQKAKELFKNASQVWKKFINQKDDEDEGGSGGKGKRASVDFYALRLANLNQIDTYHKITRASRNARIAFAHQQNQSSANSQETRDKQARKASHV